MWAIGLDYGARYNRETDCCLGLLHRDQVKGVYCSCIWRETPEVSILITLIENP